MGRLQDAVEACLEACCLRLDFYFSDCLCVFAFIVCIPCREDREESDYWVEHTALCKFICEGFRSPHFTI